MHGSPLWFWHHVVIYLSPFIAATSIHVFDVFRRRNSILQYHISRYHIMLSYQQAQYYVWANIILMALNTTIQRWVICMIWTSQVQVWYSTPINGWMAQPVKWQDHTITAVIQLLFKFGLYNIILVMRHVSSKSHQKHLEYIHQR